MQSTHVMFAMVLFLVLGAGSGVAVMAQSNDGGVAPGAEPADPSVGGMRRAVESAIQLEEKRMEALRAFSEKAMAAVAELESSATERDASAAQFYKHAQAFRSASKQLKGNSRVTVNGFATAMNTYARGDQEMAGKCRQAANALRAQAKVATASAADHGRHVEEMRQSLGDWK